MPDSILIPISHIVVNYWEVIDWFIEDFYKPTLPWAVISGLSKREAYLSLLSTQNKSTKHQSRVGDFQLESIACFKNVITIILVRSLIFQRMYQNKKYPSIFIYEVKSSCASHIQWRKVAFRKWRYWDKSVQRWIRKYSVRSLNTLDTKRFYATLAKKTSLFFSSF